MRGPNGTKGGMFMPYRLEIHSLALGRKPNMQLIQAVQMRERSHDSTGPSVLGTTISI